MKQFIIRTSVFLAIFVTPFLLIWSFSAAVKITGSFDNYTFNRSIDQKVSKLDVNYNRLNIIIAGDSRAERQLIPSIIRSRTGYNSINIAVSSGDLVSTIPAIKSHGDSNVFIISASSWQINDGAVEPGYLSLKCFSALTFFEKIRLYRKNPKEMFLKENELFKTALEYFYYDNIKKRSINKLNKFDLKEDGFVGTDATFSIDSLTFEKKLTNHPWYKDLNFNGARWRIFLKSIEKLNNCGSLVIIYQPPVTSYWRDKTDTTIIGTFEKEYSKRLDSLSRYYENIVFYDFYSTTINSLTDSMYYDMQHLNRNGAELFSHFFSDIIMKELKARMHNKKSLKCTFQKFN